MIIFRTDGLPGPGREIVNRTYYLALLLRKQVPVFFCLDKNIVVTPEFRKKNICFVTPGDLSKEKKKGFKSMVFNVGNFGPDDQALLNWSRDQGLKTIQFTDPGLNRQPVDFTIDSSLEPLTPYPKDLKGLLGPEYTILHTKFRHFNRVKKMIRKHAKMILLSPGSKMNYRQLRNLVDGLARHHMQIKINAGPGLRKSHRKILKRIYPQIGFVGKVESLARPFYESDMALISTGPAAYEAAACGTPALYLYDSPQEEFIAEAFEKRGIGLKAEYVKTRPGDRIGEQIKSLDSRQREAMGIRGKQTVDGLGVYRIIDFFQNNDII